MATVNNHFEHGRFPSLKLVLPNERAHDTRFRRVRFKPSLCGINKRATNRASIITIWVALVKLAGCMAEWAWNTLLYREQALVTCRPFGFVNSCHGPTPSRQT